MRSKVRQKKILLIGIETKERTYTSHLKRVFTMEFYKTDHGKVADIASVISCILCMTFVILVMIFCWYIQKGYCQIHET